MHSSYLLGVGAAVLILAVSALPASAHHGWAGNGIEFEISGTVETGVSLAGPHATMKIRDAEGQVWDITLSPPARTRSAGLHEDVIPVGETVTIRGWRSSNPNRLEIKTERVTWNGQAFDVYPPGRGARR